MIEFNSAMDKGVGQYLSKQPSVRKEICEKLRKLIFKTFPDINEEMKFGVPWYTGRFYIVGLKDHVNLGFSVFGLPEKYRKELEGKGKFMRHLKFFSVSEIDEKKVVRLMKTTDKYFKDPHPGN